MHFRGVNWGRDLDEPQSVDIRNAQRGDPSPSGRGTLEIARGIEVGHIFQLGTLYSESMHASVLDVEGRALTMYMGLLRDWRRHRRSSVARGHRTESRCQRRYLSAAPEAIAPFKVVLVPINYQKSMRVQEAADALYQQFTDAGIDVLLDDRDARPGVKFADSELMGIPHRIVIGERGLAAGNLEYRHRGATESAEIPAADPVGYIRQKLIA